MDTAGQERFRSITSSFFKGAHAIIIVYDITKRETFDNVAGWISEISNSAPSNVKKIIVGNKSDLDKERQVPIKSGEALAKHYNFKFFETSAKLATNIVELFQAVAKIVHTGKPD